MPEDRVRRFDFAPSLSPPVRMENGWLKVSGKIARTGIQEYVDATGKVTRELRLPEEVFDPESVASFALVPFTDTHPPKLLDAADANKYARGSVGNVRKLDEEWLAAEILVWDQQAIASIEAGRHQLSNGYECTLDSTQIPELIAKWGPYDQLQRRIRGNHVAGVDLARAGSEAAMRLDAGDARLILPNEKKNSPTEIAKAPKTENPMPQTLRIDGFTFEMNDANAASIQQAIERALTTQRADSDKKVAELQAKLDAAQKRAEILKANGLTVIGERDRLRGRLDAMKARMVGCDECDGTGEVEGAKCDYCDGKGEFRMHDAVSALTHTEEGKADDPDDGDGDDDDEESLDADELETEQATEEEAGKANKDKRADSRKRRADERAKARKRWDAKEERKLERATKQRSALLVEAQKHLGADAKLDGLGAAAIKRKVIEKLVPSMKLDGLSPAAIGERYETAKAMASAQEPNAADLLRAGTGPLAPTTPPVRKDGNGGSQLRGRAAMLANLKKA